MGPLLPEEVALHEAFRVLRERVFEGTDAFRERVIDRVEREIHGRPAEPLGITLVVHAVNFLAALFADRPTEPSEATRPRPEDGAPLAADEDDPEDPPR